MGSAIGFITQIVLARQLGAETYGLFASSLGTINLVMPLAGFGIASLWLKVFGEEGWSAIRWVKPSLVFLFLSSASVVLFLYLWSEFGGHDNNTSYLIKALSLTVVGQACIELIKSKLQLEEKFLTLTVYQLIVPLLRLLLVSIIFFLFTPKVEYIAVGYSSISIVMTLYCIRCFNNLRKGNIELVGHGNRYEVNTLLDNIGTLNILNNSWVFGFATTFYVLWSQSNIVLIKYLLGDNEAGIYNVSLLVITALCILPSVIYSKYLMPKIHRWASQEKDKLKNVFYLGNKLMFLFGIGFMFLVLISSEFLIPIIFGDEYKYSSIILSVLSLTLPLRFVGHSVGALLVAKNYMKVKVKVMALVATLNIVLNFITIPNFGLLGVAYVAIFNEAFLLLLYYLLVKKYYINKDWK